MQPSSQPLPSPLAPFALTTDCYLGNQLPLVQPLEGHKIGMDALILAASAPRKIINRPTARVADLGAGVGGVGLFVSKHPLTKCQIDLLEKNQVLSDISAHNIALNGFGARVSAQNYDLFESEYLPRLTDHSGLHSSLDEKKETQINKYHHKKSPGEGIYDLILTNPPFYSPKEMRSAKNPLKREAHQMEESLTAWLKEAMRLLTPKGEIVMIHRTSVLDEAINALSKHSGALQLVPIHSKADEPATRIIIRAKLGSKAVPSILPAISIHLPAGGFTETALAINQGTFSLWE